MIAAYLVGPAFGWSNIRLCINLGNDLFASNPEDQTHPADDARNEAICLMLEKVEIKEEEIFKMKNTWEKFVKIGNQEKPKDYNTYFPHPLLVELRDFIYHRCKSLGLISYTDHALSSSEFRIAYLLNTAWDQFNESPSSFPGWESKQINRLKCYLNL